MTKYLFTAFAMIVILESKAQINVDDQLNRRVRNLSQFRQIRYRTVNVAGVDMKFAEFKRVKKIEYTITAGDANLRTDRLVHLPEQLVVNYYSNKNCSDTKRGWTQELTLKVTEGQSAKTTTKITSTHNINVNFGFKIPIPGLASATAAYTYNYSTENGSEGELTNTKEETIARTINLDVDSNKALFVKFQTTRYSLRVPFTANLVVDGEVTVEKVSRTRLGTNNSDKVVGEEVIPLRRLLSSDQRNFRLSGYIENSKAGLEQVEFAEIKLPGDSCEEFIIEPLISIIEKLAGNKALTTEEMNTLNSSPFATAIKAKARNIRFNKIQLPGQSSE